MAKFEAPTLDDSTGEKLVAYRDRTTTDDLSDVSWLAGELKIRMQQVFLQKHGQYFDDGVRVTA